MVASPSLFERDWPLGFNYREDFITETEERDLLDAIGQAVFSDFEMRGVVARGVPVRRRRRGFARIRLPNEVPALSFPFRAGVDSAKRNPRDPARPSIGVPTGRECSQARAL